MILLDSAEVMSSQDWVKLKQASRFIILREQWNLVEVYFRVMVTNGQHTYHILKHSWGLKQVKDGQRNEHITDVRKCWLFVLPRTYLQCQQDNAFETGKCSQQIETYLLGTSNREGMMDTKKQTGKDNRMRAWGRMRERRQEINPLRVSKRSYSNPTTLLDVAYLLWLNVLYSKESLLVQAAWRRSKEKKIFFN